MKNHGEDPKHAAHRENFRAKDFLRLIWREAKRRDDQHADQ